MERSAESIAANVSPLGVVEKGTRERPIMKYAPQLAYRAALGLCLLLSSQLVICAPPPVEVTPAANNVKYASSLSRFMARDEHILLRNSSSDYVLFVPVSARWQVRRAGLHLEFSYSNALVAGRSQLIVSLNQRRVAQLPL